MKNLIFICLVASIIFSCSSDDSKPTNNPDYLIFGHFYGFCIGESCIEIFKLEDHVLYEDSNDNYALNNFNFEALDNAQYNIAKDLIDSFPSELLNETENVLGCPDCADGGGIFIEYSINGTIQNWRIDQMKHNVPSYLHDFIDEVNETIGLINE